MNSPSPLHLRLFGSPQIVRPDGLIVSGKAVQRHRLALLALLALTPGRCMTRDRLVAYLWPESDTEHARPLLNQSVYQLRRTLGEGAIRSTGDELCLDVEVITADVVAFQSACAVGDCRAAAALYSGPLLDGFFLPDSPEFERWVDRERDRLSAAYADALEVLAARAEESGDLPTAAAWWRIRAAHDPYDSRAALSLMRTLMAAGNPAGALQHRQAHARLLREEFGIVPAREIEDLADRLRRQTHQAPPEDVGEVPRSAARAREIGRAASPEQGTPGHGHDSAHPEREADGFSPRRTPRFVPLLTALLAVGAVIFAFWIFSADDPSLVLGDTLATIERHLDDADWESAFALTQAADERYPATRELDEIWPRTSWRVTLQTEPAGAMVYRRQYGATDTTWERLGRTPLRDIRIPFGLSLLRFELPGYVPLLRAVGGAHVNWAELRPAQPDMLLVGPEHYRLDTESTLPAGMVRVSGWDWEDGSGRIALGDFFIARHEVTNGEYRQFIEAGGYERPELWDPIEINGDMVEWPDAIVLFVDLTGRQGPATWEAGDYPLGEDDFPVTGVSWYEARAFARYAGRELPTAHHWEQAVANSMFLWLLPASNFSSAGPRAVNAGTAMTHVGSFDMTGNVREWTATSIGSERVILGGSWSDPYYIAGTPDVSASPLDRSPANGLRLALTADPPDVAARVRAPLIRTTTSRDIAQRPAAADVYAAYARMYTYDRTHLDASIEAVDTTRLWIRERVSLAAAYDGERMLLHLYRPTSTRPPFQTVVYWPGWDAFVLNDADLYAAKQVDFIVKSGRAVAFPIYKGTFDRRGPSGAGRPDFGTAEYRDNAVKTVKDMQRSVDYLLTRGDIDADGLAFFGYSWGGVNGPLALALETRFAAAVINIGLLPAMSGTPEADPLHALPRVAMPVLLFSGEFDPMVPRANAAQYFDLLGTAPERKRHVVAIGGHFVPRALLIRETLDWLDTHLGPRRKAFGPPE